jgi:hypothetical protein
MAKEWQDFSVLGFLLVMYFVIIAWTIQVIAHPAVDHARRVRALFIIVVWLSAPVMLTYLGAFPELWRTMSRPFR